MAYIDLLNRTAEIQEKTFAQDPTGQKIETWASKGSFPVRKSRNGSAKVVDGVYKVTTDDFLFFFENDVDIKREDRIILDGITYSVIALYEVDDMQNHHHTQVYASRQDNG